MQLTALKLTKLAVSGVVGMGAGKIAHQVIKNNINPETLMDKVSMVAGAWALGGIATQAAKKYTNEMIDDTVKLVTETLADFKEQAALGRINRGETTFMTEGLNPDDFEQIPTIKDGVSTLGEWKRKPKADDNEKTAS